MRPRSAAGAIVLVGLLALSGLVPVAGLAAAPANAARGAVGAASITVNDSIPAAGVVVPASSHQAQTSGPAMSLAPTASAPSTAQPLLKVHGQAVVQAHGSSEQPTIAPPSQPAGTGDGPALSHATPSPGRATLGVVNATPLADPTMPGASAPKTVGQVVYAVTFTETGLPSGSWSVTINGTLYTAPVGDPLQAELPNGSFTYAITDYAGYHEPYLPYEGTGEVAGPTNEPVLIFVPVTYLAVFVATGLPVGVYWAMEVNGSLYVVNSTGPTYSELDVSVSNGTVPYIVPDVGGWHEWTFPYSGALEISGGAAGINGSSAVVNETLAFEPFGYDVVFQESGLTGERWSVTFNGTEGSAIAPAPITFQSANASILNYSVAGLSGWATVAYHGAISIDGGDPPPVVVAWEQVLYTVTFHETGLTGEKWAVTFNGSTSARSISSTVTFRSPNGSFPFNLSNVPNWQASSYHGGVSVSGANPATTEVTFTLVTYAVTFTETGLTGEGWSVTFNGTASPWTTASTIDFVSPNGSYPYAVANTPGWRLLAYSGTVAVHGASSGPTLAWSQQTYSITFTESGLTGERWSVSFNGTLRTVTAPASITFQSPNGTYPYTVSPLPGWMADGYGGALSPEGSGSNQEVSWTQVSYVVTFRETGLTGEAWAVTFNGTTSARTTATSITFQSPNGTYPYSLLDVPGWRANGYAGNVGVSGGPATATSSWAQLTYAVTFAETGLTGESWGVTFNGTLQTQVAPGSIVFFSPNGTYPYVISPIPGWQTHGYSGDVAVSGSPPSDLTVAWTRTTYAVTFTETGLTGERWAVTLNNSVSPRTTSGTIVFQEPNGTLPYNISNVAGWRANSYSSTIMVVGAPTGVTVAWSQVNYSVTFRESGLTGESWAVTFNGSESPFTTSGTISYASPNGSYPYGVTPIDGWHASSYSGALPVDGGATGLTIVWAQVTYLVSFRETGLTGEGWAVTFNGSTSARTTASTITFASPNGSFSYNLSDVPGWQSASYDGSVNIAGSAPAAVQVTWAQVTYLVTFSENGLPGGTQWSIMLNGTLFTSVEATLSAGSLPNGTYSYTVGRVPAYSWTPTGGVFNVAAGPTSVPAVAFVRLPPSYFGVTFNESGLPRTLSWGVTVNGTLYSAAAGSAITVYLQNGTYAYRIADVGGWHQTSLPYSGSVVVTGAPVMVTSLAFVQAVYTVTFEETGLGVGLTWSVTMNGTTYRELAPDPIQTELPNGTFAYTLGDVPGWHQRTIAYAGSVTVGGGPVGMPTLVFVQVLYAVTFTESGLPLSATWSVGINGTFQVAAAGTPITGEVANGSFPYAIDDVGGYHQLTLPYVGTQSMEGASIVEPTLLFSAVTYPVAFTETGLANGVTWGVTINGTLISAYAGDPVTTDLPNGSFPYQIADVSGWHQTTLEYSGRTTVSGGPVNEPILIFTQEVYSVSFTARGLALNVVWGVVVNGTLYFGFGPGSVSTALPNGSFTYQIGDVQGWHQTTLPYDGIGEVQGGPVNEPALVFTQVVYTVTFGETGLPDGTPWSVTINGTSIGSHTPESISANLPNGSFTYSIAAVAGWHQSSLPYSGSGTISGGPVTMTTLRFARALYNVTFSESGLPSGATWRVTVNGTEVTGLAPGSLVAALPNGTFVYRLADVAGWHLSGGGYSGGGSIAGQPVSEGFIFRAVTYSVTFIAAGLPSGTWTVTLNGTAITQPVGSNIVQDLPNGSFAYTVGDYPGYHQNTLPYSGLGRIDGGAVTEPTLRFTLVTYRVTFTQTGLNFGGNWTVTLDGRSIGTTGAPITFAGIPNGTLGFTIAAPGYRVDPDQGNLTIAGRDYGLSVNVTSLAQRFSITFTEQGLANGTWSVTLNGTTGSGAALTPIAFEGFINGSYRFSVAAVPGYGITPGAGSVAVNGSLVMVTVIFTAQPAGTSLVAFSESGLPSGNDWSVGVDRVGIQLSSADVIVFALGNGPYNFSVTGSGPWRDLLTGNGSFTVLGSPLLISVGFDFSSAVTFVQNGIPNGTTWTLEVTLLSLASGPVPTVPAGSSWFVNATGSATTIYLANGSFRFTITAPGYQSTSDPFTVSGAAQTIPATVQPNPPASSLPWWLWIIVGVGAAAVVVALGLLWGRYSRGRAGGPRPPGQP